MKNFTLLLLLFCFLFNAIYLVGQQKSIVEYTKEEIDSILYDTLSNINDTDIPHTIMMQKGYIINYFYKKGNNYYKYNIIFTPSSKLIKPFLEEIISISKVVNKGKPLNEHYILSLNDTSIFENLFRYSYVVKHTTGMEEDSLCKLMGYNIMNTNLLFSEFYQFNPPTLNSTLPDSIGIVFKMIEVNAIIKIERYDSISRNNHLKVISDYIPPQNYIWITVYRELVKCELDSRLISPIFAQVLTVEFIDRKRRKFVKRVVKMRRN